jgi:hypothetical protein
MPLGGATKYAVREGAIEARRFTSTFLARSEVVPQIATIRGDIFHPLAPSIEGALMTS